jgi:thiol-disulfide isomerase/thioredoxin
MHRHAQLLLLALLSFLILGFHFALKEKPDRDEIREMAREVSRPQEWQTKVAPDVQLTLQDGSSFNLSDEIGRRVVILNFFATWCQPCRAEMPELTRYAKQHANDPLVMIGIDAHEDPKLVNRFVSEVGVGFPVGIDSGSIIEAYGVKSYPTTVLIGVDGRVHLYETTAIMNAEVALEARLQAELARLRSGGSVTSDAWRQALANEDFSSVREAQSASSSGEAPLTGRAQAIAQRMGCVCGCKDTLLECTCNTARGMRAKLRRGDFGEKTDVQIMESVNAEFCMKGM